VDLAEQVAAEGAIPLSWAAATPSRDHLNLGDALSPVMVALVSGRPVRHSPFRAATPRLAAVGTIAQNLAGGEVHVWGTGCSPWINPHQPEADRLPYVRPPGTRLRIHATRGPLSEQLLTARMRPWGRGIYGDPVWLLPRFYRPRIRKRWKLGVIPHLSQLASAALNSPLKPKLRCFQVPSELAGEVRIITTRTAISLAAMGERLDEILACERIVSVSLHGLVIAEAYGIPCLHFSAGRTADLVEASLAPDQTLDLRVADLYAGLGLRSRPAYRQPLAMATDWGAVMVAVDRAWSPLTLDGDRLLRAFPLEARPFEPPVPAQFWCHPLLGAIALQHRRTAA